MQTDIEEWKLRMQHWASNNEAVFNISRPQGLVFYADIYTADIIKTTKSGDIIISQSGVFYSKFKLRYLKLEYINKHICNLDMSLYQKGFLERIFSFGKLNSGNRLFDKKFGVYTSNKHIALNLFKNKRVQDLFLNNKFLLLNMQKDNSTLVLKSMEAKFYEETELQELLDSFIHIVNILNKKND